MTTQKATDRGLELCRTIASLKEELAACEAQLKAAALEGNQVALEDPERDGRQFLARGTNAIVPVVLTADLLVGSFADGSRQHARLEAVAQGKLLEFFTLKRTWHNAIPGGKAFRREAAAILGGAAPEFIAAAVVRDKYGVPRSQIKVEWDRAKEDAQ